MNQNNNLIIKKETIFEKIFGFFKKFFSKKPNEIIGTFDDSDNNHININIEQNNNDNILLSHDITGILIGKESYSYVNNINYEIEKRRIFDLYNSVKLRKN